VFSLKGNYHRIHEIFSLSLQDINQSGEEKLADPSSTIAVDLRPGERDNRPVPNSPALSYSVMYLVLGSGENRHFYK